MRAARGANAHFDRRALLRCDGGDLVPEGRGTLIQRSPGRRGDFPFAERPTL
jgi:hypothetical protein